MLETKCQINLTYQPMRRPIIHNYSKKIILFLQFLIFIYTQNAMCQNINAHWGSFGKVVHFQATICSTKTAKSLF